MQSTTTRHKPVGRAPDERRRAGTRTAELSRRPRPPTPARPRPSPAAAESCRAERAAPVGPGRLASTAIPLAAAALTMGGSARGTEAVGSRPAVHAADLAGRPRLAAPVGLAGPAATAWLASSGRLTGLAAASTANGLAAASTANGLAAAGRRAAKSAIPRIRWRRPASVGRSRASPPEAGSLRSSSSLLHAFSRSPADW